MVLREVLRIRDGRGGGDHRAGPPAARRVPLNVPLFQRRYCWGEPQWSGKHDTAADLPSGYIFFCRSKYSIRVLVSQTMTVGAVLRAGLWTALTTLLNDPDTSTGHSLRRLLVFVRPPPEQVLSFRRRLVDFSQLSAISVNSGRPRAHPLSCPVPE